MKCKELMENVEFQTEVKFCWYDYDKTEELIFISEEEANEKEIKYIYTEEESIYIEIDMEN